MIAVLVCSHRPGAMRDTQTVWPMQRIGQTVWVSRMAPGLWLHTSTAIITEGGGVYFPANGLILDRQEGSLLIDTGYLPEHAEALMKWSKQTLPNPIRQ